MKCSGKHDTTWTIPRSITFSPLHFMLYRGKSISFGTVQGGLRRRGGIFLNIFFICFTLYYNFMNILKFKDKKKIWTKNALTVQIFTNLPNHPIFHSEERLVNFVRGGEGFVGLSILVVHVHCYIVESYKKIYTEEKAQVVAGVWGTEFFKFLDVLAILHHKWMKKRMNCTRIIWRIGWIHPILKTVIVKDT